LTGSNWQQNSRSQWFAIATSTNNTNNTQSFTVTGTNGQPGRASADGTFSIATTLSGRAFSPPQQEFNTGIIHASVPAQPENGTNPQEGSSFETLIGYEQFWTITKQPGSNDTFIIDGSSQLPTPEPTSLALAVFNALGLMVFAWRRRRGLVLTEPGMAKPSRGR
jgi:hypothetical protein